jgi:fucose permease
MRSSRTLSRAERVAAVCLALIWIAAGCAGLYAALIQSRWIAAVCALLALAYGIAWARAAAFSRLLTWPKLLAPWRSSRGGG